MVFGELTRWRMFGESLTNLCRHVGESLANGFWRTDTLGNLWRIFAESLANLWRMAFGKLTCWRIFG